jgi:anti-repressor protein
VIFPLPSRGGQGDTNHRKGHDVSELVPFEFRGVSVRVVTIDGEPWFVAGDVAYVLGYSNSRDAVAKHVRDSQRRVSRIATPSGGQSATVISEGGLYRLMLRARTALADEFQDWVTEQVLPEIRKTGSYGERFEIPQTYAEALELAAKQTRQLEVAEQRAAALEPAARSWDILADAEGDYSLRDAAQILDRDPAISTGQNRLSAYLKGIAWTDRTGRPYQAQVDLGRLAVRVTSYPHPRTGEDVPTRQPRVTVKGLHELHKRMGGSGPLLLAA